MLGLLWIALVGGLFWGLPFSNFLHPESSFLTTLGVVNFLIFIGIPLLMVILFVMRLFMRTHFKPRWAAGLWVFWLINLVSLMFVAMSTVREFSAGATLPLGSSSELGNPDTLFIEIEKNPYEETLLNFDNELIIADKKLISSNIDLRIEKSESGRFEIIQENYSRGGSNAESKQLASGIDYQYRVEGNKIIFPSTFEIPEGSKWRGQQANFIIKVPEGKWVKASGYRTFHFLHNLDVDRNYKFPWWRDGYTWLMGAEGLISPAFIQENQKDYSFEGFSKIRLEGPIKLNIRRGDLFTVTLKNGEQYRDELNVNQSGEQLSISTNAEPDRPIVFDITMPTLEEVLAVESDDIEIRDFNLEKLRIVNEGEAQIKAFVNVNALDVELSGGNELDVRGEGMHLKALLDDNARMDAEHFTIKTADLEATNGSWIKVSASDTLRQQVENSEIISKLNPVVISEAQ